MNQEYGWLVKLLDENRGKEISYIRLREVCMETDGLCAMTVKRWLRQNLDIGDWALEALIALDLARAWQKVD